MKKTSIFAAAIALLAASCSNESEELETETETLVPVTVQVNDFSVSMEDPNTRATDVASYDGIKALTLAFYDTNGTEVYKTTQQKSDNTTYTTFGQFKLNLYKGSYTMVVVGRDYFANDVFTLTSPTEAAYTGARARDTFTSTQAVDITNTNAVNLNTTLDRIVAKVLVESTDIRIAEADSIRTTLSAGGKSFNPSTGLALTNTGFSNTLKGSGLNNDDVAQVGTYVFLQSDEQTMNVTIDVLDKDKNVITHREVNNVPLKRNRTTKLTGLLFSASLTSTFQVNADWLPEEEVSF